MLDKKGNVIQPEKQLTIGQVGCALTCMAMVLKTLGYDYNPLKLNEKMTEDGYFTINEKGNWSGGVDWRAVTDYASDKIKEKPIRIGEQSNWDTKTPLDIQKLDSHLSKNNFVIALVGNPKKNGTVSNHWVILSGNENGTYHIVDPGCYPRTTLNSYQNKIYRAIIYERK